MSDTDRHRGDADNDLSTEPRQLLDDVDRIQERIRSRRWWYVITCVVMTVVLSVYYFGMLMDSSLVRAWFIPGFLVVFGLLIFFQWRAGSVPQETKNLEIRTTWISLLLVAPLLVIGMLPGQPSPWLGLLGVLPALPWAVLAWRVGRA